MLTRVVGVMLIALVVASQPHTARGDDGAECVRKNRYGVCVIEQQDPSIPAPGPGDGHSPKAPRGGKGGPIACIDHKYQHPAAAVACKSDDGIWSSTYQCYSKPMSPQPEAGNPAWPKDRDLTGVIYECRAPAYVGGANVTVYWSATPPGGLEPPDPLVLAREAIAAMRLAPVDIGLAPKPSPQAAGLIRLPVWMWVDQPRASTWGPITRSASDQGLTVTATASVDRVLWTMGDGSSVSCGKRTPRTSVGGSMPSPDCGYAYSKNSAAQNGGTYTISATSHWTVRWTGGGQSGTIPLDLSSQTQLRIVESHPVLTSP